MTRERTQLLEQAKSELVDAGFVISSDCDVRPSCFDFVARKDDRLVLVKILSNVGSLTNEDADALLRVAHFFNAIPLVVGTKTQRGALDDDTVYKRYGLPTITISLLKKAVREEDLPREYIQRGGRFVAIDGAKLREVRASRGMTKENLAKCVEVSARAILAYEKHEMDVGVDVAERLESVLETDLIIPIDLLQKRQPDKSLGQHELPGIPENVSYLERRVSEFLERIGMKVLWTNRAPFNVAGKEEGPPLMSSVGSLSNPCLQKRVEVLKSVSKVTESDAVIIVEEGKAQERVSEVPVIRQFELDEIEKSGELRRIIAERSES